MPAAILHIITRLDRGGTVGAVLPLLDAARARGHRVRLIAGDTPDGRMVAAARPDLDIAFLPGLRREIHPPRDLAALLALAREIRRFRPALVHTHTSKAGALGRIAARLLGVPAVVHSAHGHVFRGYFHPLASRLVVAVERALAPLADRLIGVSRGEIEETLAAGIGTRGRFRLVPSGVAAPPPGLSRAAARARFGMPPEARVVAFVGRLEPVKGPDLLVEAFETLAPRLPDLRLLLCGDGALAAGLKRRLAGRGLETRAAFAGWLDPPWDAFACADAFAAPSRMEGLGKAAIEALLCGLPVACAAVGGLATLAAPGRPVFPHAPDDPAALSAALEAALARPVRRDPALAAGLLREYGVEPMARRAFAVYREALAARGRGGVA